ncbi:MAG TPA: hypothetical protein VNA13_04105 [Xanthomonadales bacterium]|nr:hypothetical protein [Xanthomonadales bacterium]
MKEPAHRTEFYSPTEALLLDRNRMSALVPRIYAEAQKPIKSGVVTASSRYCAFVAISGRAILKAEGLEKVEYIEYSEPRNRGSVSHAFLKVKDGNRKWVVDFQYKQYSPEGEREELPDYLVIPYTSRENVIKSLEEHHIPQNHHHRWLVRLFDDI